MTSTEIQKIIDASVSLLALSRASRETAKQSLARSKKVPTGIYSLQVVLPLLESTLEKTQHSATEGKLDGNTCKRLLPEIQSCRSKIEELHANLVQLMRSIKSRTFRSFFRSKTTGAEKKQLLKSLAEDIMRCHLQLAQAGAKCPSDKEISSITATAGIRLDYYLEYMIDQLKESQVISPVLSSMSKEHLAVIPKDEAAELSRVDTEEVAKLDSEEAAKSEIKEVQSESVEQSPGADAQQPLEEDANETPQVNGADPPKSKNVETPKSDSQEPAIVNSTTTTIQNDTKCLVAKAEAKETMVRTETKDSVISNQANATSEDKTQANFYFNLFCSQVLDLMETEQGPVPRVFGGRLPDNHAFSKTELSPRKETFSPQHGIAAVQFEEACPVYPAHPAKLDDSSSKDSTEDSTAKGQSYITSRPMSPASPYRLPTPPSPPSGLVSALDDIRFAHFNSVSLPNVAQQVSQNAVDVLTDYHPPSPLLAMRKLRALTAAELELSRVTQPPGVHAKAARIYCDKALKTVDSIKGGAGGSESNDRAAAVKDLRSRWRARVRLDAAEIAAELARAQTVNGDLSNEIKRTRREALEAYQDVVRELKDRCVNVEDDEVLARALLGSGRMVKQVGVVDGGSLSGTEISSDAESAVPEAQDEYGRSRSVGFIEGMRSGSTTGESGSTTRRNGSITGRTGSTTGRIGSMAGRNGSLAGWRASWMRGSHSREIAGIARGYFREANAIADRGLARKVGEGVKGGLGEEDEADEDAAREMLTEVKAEIKKAMFMTRS